MDVKVSVKDILARGNTRLTEECKERAGREGKFLNKEQCNYSVTTV
jgi:hypothetical protein